MAYTASYQVQWINFASWLIAGALVLLGAALLWTFVQALAAKTPHRRPAWVLFGLIMATFVAGFINALQHAKDAGATMPTGLILSVVVFICCGHWLRLVPRGGRANVKPRIFSLAATAMLLVLRKCSTSQAMAIIPIAAKQRGLLPSMTLADPAGWVTATCSPSAIR